VSQGGGALAVVLGIDRWLRRHRRIIGLLSAAWFALVCADYAGFIHLPRLIAVPASLAVIVSFVRYGVWEAFVAPKVVAGRKDQTDS
jgi:hypothetical protein